MLHKETVGSSTLELLIELQRDTLLKDFFLVGETALSLQIGHRISIDIDLFNIQLFNEEEILIHLINSYQFILDYRDKNSLKGEINGVKVDFISHQYPLFKNIVIENDIRLSSLHDLAGMKLNAIISNGTRLKDFIDIAFLSSYLSLNQMIESYEFKYHYYNPMMFMKSLTYFNDINFKEPIKLLNKDFEWDLIKKRIEEMCVKPQNIFDKL